MSGWNAFCVQCVLAYDITVHLSSLMLQKQKSNENYNYISVQQATVETFQATDDSTTRPHYVISEYGGGGVQAVAVAVSGERQVALEGWSIPTALWLAAADNSGCLSDSASSARCLVRLLCVGNSFARGSVRLRHSRERSGNCGRPLCIYSWTKNPAMDSTPHDVYKQTSATTCKQASS